MRKVARMGDHTSLSEKVIPSGYSSAASEPGRGRPSCSPSSPAPNGIESNPGLICANCCSACMTTIHVSMRCSPTNGRGNTPRPCSTTDSKNLVAKRQLGVVAAVTREQAVGPADRRTHTMPRPDAYSKISFSASQYSVVQRPRSAVGRGRPIMFARRIDESKLNRGPTAT